MICKAGGWQKKEGTLTCAISSPAVATPLRTCAQRQGVYAAAHHAPRGRVDAAGEGRPHLCTPQPLC